MVRKFSIAGRDLNGVVAIVTGSSSGIGRETAKALYAQGAHVIMACRSEAKTNQVIEQLQGEVKNETNGKLEFMQLALDDLSNVRSFAKAFLAKNLPLHLLINNAGIGGTNDGQLSKDGFEPILATNHLGHFLLTELLMDKLKETADALKSNKSKAGDLTSVRIVNVASRAHQFIAKPADFKLDDWKESKKGVSAMGNYGRSKMANCLHAKQLARRLKKDEWDDRVKVYSLHPGVVATDIWRVLPSFLQPVVKWFMISEEEGSFTTLYCALSGEVETLSGEYFDDCQLVKQGTSARSNVIDDEPLAEALWQKSEEIVKPFLGK